MPLWGPEGTYPGGGTVKRSAPARKSQAKSATAVKPPPKSAAIEIVSADGTRLNAQWWRATAPSPKTVVLLIHGVHQSSVLYRPDGPSQLVRRLNAEAPADVLGVDLRGFGRSAGSYNVRNFDLFLQDIRAALRVADARAKELGARVVYFGHSLGGLLGAALACDASPPEEVAAYILSAPTVDHAVGPAARAVVSLVARCLPGLALGSLGGGGDSNNPAYAKELRELARSRGDDGLPFKARYVAAAFDLIGRLKPNFGRFHRPLLVLSGPPPPGSGRGPPGRVGFDMHYAGVASMASAVRAAAVVPVELLEVPDAPHELVFEPDVNASVDRIVRYCADVSAAA